MYGDRVVVDGLLGEDAGNQLHHIGKRQLTVEVELAVLVLARHAELRTARVQGELHLGVGARSATVHLGGSSAGLMSDASNKNAVQSYIIVCGDSLDKS